MLFYGILVMMRMLMYEIGRYKQANARRCHMGYYNYHGQAKKLIKEGHLLKFEIVDRWNQISPALVLYFDNHLPMPIREEKWSEYLAII